MSTSFNGSPAIFAGGGNLLALVYGGAYVKAADALRILAFCVPLFYVNYALTHQLIAWDGQRVYLAITVVALFTKVIGNILLIPAAGMSGAALSTLITEFVVCGGCLAALARR